MPHSRCPPNGFFYAPIGWHSTQVALLLLALLGTKRNVAGSILAKHSREVSQVTAITNWSRHVRSHVCLSKRHAMALRNDGALTGISNDESWVVR